MTRNLGLRLRVFYPATGSSAGAEMTNNRTAITLIDRRLRDCIMPPDNTAPAFGVWAAIPEFKSLRADQHESEYAAFAGVSFFLLPEGARPSEYVFGGNFAFSNDERFRSLSPYPLPIHDRRAEQAAAESTNRTTRALTGAITK